MIPSSPSRSTASRIFSGPVASDASSQTSLENDDARTIIPANDISDTDKSNQCSQEENLMAVGTSSINADYYDAWRSLRRVTSDDIEGRSWSPSMPPPRKNLIRKCGDNGKYITISTNLPRMLIMLWADSSTSTSSTESPANSIKRTTSYTPSLSSTSSLAEETRQRIRESYAGCGSIDAIAGLTMGGRVDPLLKFEVEELGRVVEGNDDAG